MSLFVVDADKCNRDGICADTCPAGIIEMKDAEGVPVPADRAEEFCIHCGHCVSVCPSSAMSHATMKPENCLPVNKDWFLNGDQVEHFLRYRRSIRTYKEKVVDRDTLTKLIDIAKYAPSGHNTQPVKWRVIYDSQEVQRLAGIVVDWMRTVIKDQPEMAAAWHLDRVVAACDAGMDRICRHAPHMIVVHASKDLRPAQAACTIALTYLELAAPALGLGACWAGYFNAASNLYPPMQEALDLPNGEVSFGAMMVGYPRYKYHRMPVRKEPEITWR